MRRLLAYLGAAALFSFAAQADTGIIAHHGKVVETAKAGLAAPGFLEIDNSAPADTLTGATCPIAGHTSLVSRNGAPLLQLPVAAGQHLMLTADGPHLLLQSTHFSIDAGAAVPCSLHFSNAGEILIYLYPIEAS